MAKSSSSKGSKDNRFNDKKFVNYTLTEAEKRALKDRPFGESDFATAVLRIVDEGYKISFSYDGYNRVYQCNLTCGDPDSPNVGFILVGRGSAPEKALKQCLWMHYERSGENWEVLVKPITPEDYDD